ncbi:MAG: SpoIIE family protein phosphatase [Spirochaetales bacterium]|nr:SpoIIE family protein phosphatase [Spirochaetales bacterium]
MKSLSLKLSVLYIFLAILNISFFTIIIFENQIDLITETSKYQTIDFANKIYYQFEDLKQEISEREEPLTEEKLYIDIRNALEDILYEYIIFNQSGLVLYQSSPAFSLKDKYRTNGQKALTKSDFLGEPYTFDVDEEAREILFYIPINFPIQNIEQLVLLFKLGMKDIDKKLTTLYSLVIVIIVTIALFHIIFGFFLHRIVISPIKTLAYTSTEISKGDLSARVKLRKKDEIGRLGVAFNNMADSVQETITKLDEQNKLMRFELAMASAVQKSIYPAIRKTKYFDVAIYHRPYMEVSGDYHNIYHLGGNKYGILIADVAGHGVAAALITMLIKERFEELAGKFADPKELLQRINIIFKDLMVDYEKYFTAFYLIINKNTQALFSNAAHPKAILLRESNVYHLSVKGILIGVSQMMEDAFETKRIALKTGDKIILYSDGITEAMNTRNEEYGIKRLTLVSQKNAPKTCDEIVKAITAHFHDFTQGAKQSDDETLLVIEIR